MKKDLKKDLKKRKTDSSDREQGLCIIGLGNPGEDGTRHNVGFQLVDELVCLLGISLKKKLFAPYIYADMRSDNLPLPGGDAAVVKDADPPQHRFTRLILVKPLTYMNKSGMVIPDILRYYGPNLCFVVAADNLDLPPGVARLKRQGGTAGHNGLRSVSEHLERNFWPLYIGVGRPSGKADVISHVLGKPGRSEQELYAANMGLWASQLLRLFSDDLDTVMELINSSRNNV